MANYDPLKVPIKMDEKIKSRLEKYALEHFGLHGRSQAANELLDLALSEKGY